MIDIRTFYTVLSTFTKRFLEVSGWSRCPSPWSGCRWDGSEVWGFGGYVRYFFDTFFFENRKKIKNSKSSKELRLSEHQSGSKWYYSKFKEERLSSFPSFILIIIITFDYSIILCMFLTIFFIATFNSINIFAAIKTHTKYPSLRLLHNMHASEIATSFLQRELGSDIEILPADIIHLRKKLLDWYQINRRLLPW